MSTFKYGFVALLLCCFSALSATETLNISATIEAPTCEVSVQGAHNGVIALGTVDITELENSEEARSSRTQFQLNIHNCKGVGWGNLLPVLKISGDQDDAWYSFRTNAQSTATHVGIRLRTTSDAGESDLITSVPYYYNLDYSSQTKKEPTDQTVSFIASIGREGQYSQIRSGTVSANVTFLFEWH